MSRSTANCDWQLSKKQVKERAYHLLKTEQWSDCSFVVGSEPNQTRINAHKLFLAMSSPVFEAMFYGGMAERNEPIPILDVQPEAFKALLEYIYSDKVNLPTFDQACELCYAAKKYMLPDLVEKCTQHLWHDLFASNACKAYEFAKLFEEPVLMEKSLQIILNETEAVLVDPSFEDVDLATLLMILGTETLNISSERDLFNAVHRWAAKECQRRNLPEDSTSMRQVIGPALEKIHFLTLTPLQFAEGPALAPLLTRDESFAVLMNISNPGSNFPMPLGFSKIVEPRQRFRPPINDIRDRLGSICHNVGETLREGHKYYCFRNLLGNSVPSANSDIMDCNLSFSVDRNICVLGIKIPTQILPIDENPNQFGNDNRLKQLGLGNNQGNSYTELLYAHLLDSDNSRLTYTHYTSRVYYNSQIEINFNRPVYIQKNKSYKIVVVLNKPGLYPLSNIQIPPVPVVCNSVTFLFDISYTESSNESLIRAIVFTY